MTMRITLPDFSAARVLVVGDIMLDRYWSGPTRRISPKPRYRWSKSKKMRIALVARPTSP